MLSRLLPLWEVHADYCFMVTVTLKRHLHWLHRIVQQWLPHGLHPCWREECQIWAAPGMQARPSTVTKIFTGIMYMSTDERRGAQRYLALADSSLNTWHPCSRLKRFLLYLLPWDWSTAEGRYYHHQKQAFRNARSPSLLSSTDIIIREKQDFFQAS